MIIQKKTAPILLVAFMLLGYQPEASAIKVHPTLTAQNKCNGTLKSLSLPRELFVVNDDIVFDCYTTGVYDIALEDEDGNIIYSGTINVVEGQSYFIYVPGLDPEEDELG